jgi:hypothetical protein
VRLAWRGRGFLRPPSERQWTLLEGVNAHDPVRLAALIREAPAEARQSNEVVGYVLSRINADPTLRAHLAAGLAHAPPRPVCDHAMRAALPDGGHVCPSPEHPRHASQEQQALIRWSDRATGGSVAGWEQRRPNTWVLHTPVDQEEEAMPK